jgi:hypothetical protein
MTARRALAALLIAAGAVISAGCEVSTLERSYTPELIAAVGAGSDQLAQIETTFTDAAEQGATFTAPDTDAAMTTLIEGRLDELSAEDITDMQAANRDSRRRVARVMRDLDTLAGDLRAARVQAAEHADLSDGAYAFLDAWNAHLTASAEQVAGLRAAMVGLRPAFGGFRRLLDAAIDTARLGHTRQFARARERFIDAITERMDDFQQTAEPLLGRTDADKRLVALLNDDSEASAIAEAVNDQHPGGYLAQLARTEDQ